MTKILLVEDEELTIEKFKSVITNLPQDITDILIKENADTSEVGDKTAKLTITFKDSSKLDVTIKVKVKEIIEAGKITPIPEINTENIEVEEVAYKGKINLTDNIKNLPEGAIVIDVSEEKIDTTKAGELLWSIGHSYQQKSLQPAGAVCQLIPW